VDKIVKIDYFYLKIRPSGTYNLLSHVAGCRILFRVILLTHRVTINNTTIICMVR